MVSCRLIWWSHPGAPTAACAHTLHANHNAIIVGPSLVAQSAITGSGTEASVIVGGKCPKRGTQAAVRWPVTPHSLPPIPRRDGRVRKEPIPLPFAFLTIHHPPLNRHRLTFLFPDCPNNGLCCFDGCADTCVDGPKPDPQPIPDPVEVVPPPVVEPVEAEAEVKPDSEEPGYEYPVPEVPLELPKPSPPPPGLPTLYGAPPI